MICVSCHDSDVSTEAEIAESVERSVVLASKFDAPFIAERAEIRAELERAGLCTLCSVLKRDAANDGEKGAN